MADVRPFSAIRYDFDRTQGDLSNLIAPPYDVLDQKEKDALLAKSDQNIVALDLPHIPPKSLGPAEVYEHSAALMRDWLDSGILMQEKEPALYLYHQAFEHEGKEYIRKMFLARVRLLPFSDGVVLPHEQTFGGPKEDRLALMKTTQCHLSPIFGLYADPENKVGKAFASTASRPADAKGTLGGVENSLWISTNADVSEEVAQILCDKNIYIADGHHRYGTALNYRDWYIQEQGGSIDEDHPANFVLFVLASMDDPGCLILPYNRVLSSVSLEVVMNAWASATEHALPDEADIVLFEGKTGKEIALQFTRRDELKALEKNQVDAWYDLDAAYLHRYLVDELLQKKSGNEPRIRYAKSVEAAKQIAKEEAGVALLVNATPMTHLRSVSEQGGLMPQKSTYFHPKLATGLAVNPLT